MNKTDITLKYALNNGYDSAAECLFHLNNPHLQSTSEPYKATFYDASGSPFKAYPDFYDSDRKLIIEYKAHQLNTCETKAISFEKLEEVQQFKGKLTFFDKLKYGWNHSIYKQAKVQSSLKSLGFDMVVVFADGTKLTKQSINKMEKAGLHWVWERDL
ncbi:hypothetical protein [uncultured Vibrio sp.]|uniref:hypothetical protein n=1 Tax=uncultured Vibrio sp. TaxID=114054 RepID=UPI00262EA3B7|nr:hypothetical protein [uncultured Vibrio sp.]